MSDITVTVKNHSGDFRKIAEVQSNTIFGDFREVAQEISGLSNVPCVLVLEKTNEAMRDSDTFESVGIESGDVFVLIPEVGGGGKN